ncbi:alanine--glyoxylate aminotransferase family protein [Rhizobium cremeum]|uniref:pyridoxamine--pyruvate transaminase n=1 Tax=Rhizobium cremeum TaxID=2813827 RepID=UPI000DE19281|nr:alanine--glyoxylate aminotransferase family protein [Rhizobium cremeum]MCJ7997302.1 alanine--glyoxylate aminotransferase family protein [Rhizobium cremeum]MCJ8002396.1 alanine--glyoxylate aminotransferase family protein [Rhizobium cremeum]
MTTRIPDPVFTLTTGPVNCYPEVLQALGKPVLYDQDPTFLQTYERVNLKAQAAFASANVPVILQGEPVLALEAVGASALSEEDVVLNLASGVYGDGYRSWLEPHAREYLEIRVPFNEVIDPASVAAMLAARPEIAVVTVCHHDTPSGTINPVKEIGEIVASSKAIFVIDAVSSFGGMEIMPEDVKADIFVAGPNKCLGCPPGLSLLAVSDKGWAKMKRNPNAPRGSILSILDWEDAWKREKPFPFTPSVAEINALEAALDLYLAEGPGTVWARHALTARACRAGIKAMGLELWAASEDFASPTTTAIRLPEGIDETALRQTMREVYGVVISAGRGATFNRLVRIGHMGPTARPIYALIAVTALGSAIARMSGKPCDVGAGAAAVMAVIDSMT